MALAKLLGHLFRKKVDEIDAQTFETLEDRVVNYSLDLYEVEFNNPEPYLFYLLLTWPYLDEEEDFKVTINKKFKDICIKRAILIVLTDKILV